MPAHRHALVIGKFYPPHQGHHQVIRTAAGLADVVSVVVMASGAESVPLASRVAWLAEEHAGEERVMVAGVHCDAPVDLGDRTVWAAQVAAMQAALRRSHEGPVDLVVTGEGYGEALATWFDADHHRVPRDGADISATAVRADLPGHWDDLAPATRRGLAARVVVVGAESTGTTTLARRLAAHYGQMGGVWSRTRWVEEYGRDYTAMAWRSQQAPTVRDVTWAPADFAAIAQEQTRGEDVAAAAGSPLLICDTDAAATAVWQRRYLGWSPEPLAPWARDLPRRDLYLVTDHQGVAWVDDGMREGDQDLRAAMTEWFADSLTDAGQPWVLLTGDFAQRWSLALRSVEPVLDRRLRFADPLSGPGFPPASGSS